MNEEIITKQKEYMEKVRKMNENKKLTYNILTMGCKLNENDSEKLIGMLEQMGYKNENDMKNANLCIINTCCVRENAEEKLFGKLRRTKKNKREKRFNNCNRRMHDAGRTYNRKIKKELSICRYNIWNTYYS